MGEVCEDKLPGAVAFSNDPPLEREGVPGGPIAFRYGIGIESLITIGDGNGVRSGMLARYGEAKAEDEPGEEAILEVESVDLRLEPSAPIED